MLPPPFPLTANFYLPSEDAPELSAGAVSEAIREHYPHAIVDWERGRQKVADDLQQLIDMGCPEIIYRGQKSLLDQTLFEQLKNSIRLLALSSALSTVWPPSRSRRRRRR